MTAMINRLPFALGFALLLIATTSCAATSPAGAYLATPIPPGMARIWFYRDLNPNDIMAQAYIRLNGAAAGVSEPGGAFYRDVPPGQYHIHVDSYVDDRHNDGDVALAPGTEAYANAAPRSGEPGIHIPEACVFGFRASPCRRSRNDGA